MTLDVVPFEPWHLDFLAVQATQLGSGVPISAEYGRALKAAGPCFSAFAGDTVIACAGVMLMWVGRAKVWSLLSSDVGTYRIGVHRAVTRFLTTYAVRRLECDVDPRSDRAVRWVRHLGFAYESTMPGYTPGGDTMDRYVRIQP